MVFGLIALAHVVEYNLIANAVAHGSLSLPILKGFALSLTQCTVAHPAAAAVYAAVGYGVKTLLCNHDNSVDSDNDEI